MYPLWIILTLLPILGGAQRFNCKGRILGAYYADAKSGCKAFHVCVRVAGGGIRDFRFFCPPGTLFHQEAQTCTDWGDDDPLACPADIYDGQFDLYRIGSGYDTKKLSSIGNREEESEFGLQRAETGDRRLSQSNVNSNAASNDLRAAHSSDFFSGQRDRGRDETASPSAAPPAPRQPPSRPVQHRQSFRRATTPRATSPTTQYTTTTTSAPLPPQPQPSSQPQYEISKRKFVRKRPVSVSTPAPALQTYSQTPTFAPNPPPQQSFQPQNYQESFQPQQNFNRRVPPQSKPTSTTPDVPPQFKEFKDEYVEVSRVTPKPNRYYPNNPTPLPSSHATSLSPQYSKKSGLVEIYNYDAQSTPGISVDNKDNRPFNLKNSFNVQEIPREDFARTRALINNNNHYRPTSTTPAVDYNPQTRTTTTTPAYKNYNSVSYETEKNNYITSGKQSYNPTTIPTTASYHSTFRPENSQNFNTIAYNTNNVFHSNSNFADPDEDDGQYHPPQGEDDGQYRPELYEGELLSGAHSLNIAASGNRLPDDQKSYSKTKSSPKKASQTAAPRPFRPAPTPTSTQAQSTRAPEYTTTVVPLTQRVFDPFQTYTTTSRPTEFPGSAQEFISTNAPTSKPTTSAPRYPEKTRPPRPQTRPAQAPTFPPNPPPRPTTRAPHLAQAANNKEDTSYDYAYYDSDPGFSEYDQIEEFGRTKKRT